MDLLVPGNNDVKVDMIEYGTAGVFNDLVTHWWSEFTQSYEDCPPWLMDLLVPGNNDTPQQATINNRI